VALVLTVAGWAWYGLHEPYAAWQGEAAEIVLEPGLHAGLVLQRLAAAGVLEHPRLARAWLSWRGGAKSLHAGEYRFDEPVTPLEVLRRLAAGDVVLHSVTLPEGLNRLEIAQRLADAGFGPYEDLVAAFDEPNLVAHIDPDATDLEGYLFPDTYHFPRGTSAGQIAETLVQHFGQVMGPELIEEAKKIKLGVRGAVTLASMIEKETSVPEERERISQVFHNRLARGMRLECDPTVIYALERAGRPVKRLTYADLRFDSPWNTYVVRGLPAGPIANPGRESLLASLRPSEGRNLYFVAKPDGGHRFSDNHSAHLQAVAEWRRYVRSSR
jgi:UPF0755 protein